MLGAVAVTVQSRGIARPVNDFQQPPALRSGLIAYSAKLSSSVFSC